MPDPVPPVPSPAGSGGSSPVPGRPDRRRLRDLVLERGYTRSAEPFLLSSGGTSHDYVDLRRTVARGEDLHLAATAVVGAIGELGIAFDAIGGMTMGADPVAHGVAMLADVAWFSVRKAEKSHGSRRKVEGFELGPGVRAVLFEDTVSTSRSLLEALDVVLATGADVVLACTMLDRGDAARPLLEGRSIPYLALLDYRDLGIEPIGVVSGTPRPSVRPADVEGDAPS